ncbi:MAG: hypothetical protein ACI8YQ_001439 [Polaribacter sp.]
MKEGFKSDYYQNKAAYTASFNTNPTAVTLLAGYRSKMDRAAYQVVLHEMNDTINFNQDSLYLWVRNMDNMGAELWLAKEQLALGETTIALSILDDMPAKFSLSNQEANDVIRFKEVAVLLTNEDLSNLNAGTLNSLRNYDQSGGQTEAWVKNVLSFYGEHYSPEYVFAAPKAKKKSEEQIEIEQTRQSVSVPSNPAKDFVNFRVEDHGKRTTSSLEILDMNGRIIKSYTEIRGGQSIIWHTKDLPSGVYFYRFLSNEGEVQSGKVILSK